MKAKQKELIPNQERTDDWPAVLVTACLAGVPYRYHGRHTPPRCTLLKRLQ